MQWLKSFMYQVSFIVEGSHLQNSPQNMTAMTMNRAVMGMILMRNSVVICLEGTSLRRRKTWPLVSRSCWLLLLWWESWDLWWCIWSISPFWNFFKFTCVKQCSWKKLRYEYWKFHTNLDDWCLCIHAYLVFGLRLVLCLVLSNLMQLLFHVWGPLNVWAVCRSCS